MAIQTNFAITVPGPQPWAASVAPRTAEDSGSPDRFEFHSPTSELMKLGGNRPQRDELRKLVELEAGNFRFPHLSYLISGNGGTGTTTLAWALAQDMQPYGVKTITVHGSDINRGGPDKLRDVFAEARRNAAESPNKTAIVVLDDVDVALPPRNNNASTESIRNQETLGVFLKESQNLVSREDYSRVLLIGTSSRTDCLDLTAKTQFQRLMPIEAPRDASERLEVLQSLMNEKHYRLGPGANLQELAEGTSGSTPADLKSVLENAEHISGGPQLSAYSLQEGRLEKKYGVAQKLNSPDWMFRLTACHELGHAVIRHYFERIAAKDQMPKAIDLICLIPRDGTAAAVELKYSGNPAKTLEYYVAEIGSNFGGRTAERLFQKGHVSAGPGSDLSNATGLAREAVLQMGMGKTLGAVQPGQTGLEASFQQEARTDEKRLLDTCDHFSSTLVRFYKDFIAAQADELLANKEHPEKLTLTGTDFAAAISRWEADPARQADLAKLDKYIREQMQALKPDAPLAYDPVTGQNVPLES